MHKFIFLNLSTNTEIVLPVTPESYTFCTGQNIATVELVTFGEYAVACNPTIGDISLACLLPAQAYPFAQATASTTPDTYLDFFNQAMTTRAVLRWVISGGGRTQDVLVEGMEYGENDGTQDVLLTLQLKPYRWLTDEGSRATTTAPSAIQAAVAVVEGISIYTIAKQFYGNSAYATALATYNSIANIALITAGTVLDLPEVALLDLEGS